LNKNSPNATTENTDITVNCVGNTYKYRVHAEDWSHRPPASETAFLGFVLEGEAYFNIDGKEYTVKKNDILFWNKGTSMYSRGKKGFFEYVAIHFLTNPPISESIIPHCFPATDPEYTEQLFMKARNEYQLKAFAYPLRVKAQLYKILNHIITSNTGFALSQKHTAILHSVLYMEKNIFSKDLDIETIAEQSGISSVYFRKVFKEIYNISPLKYITDKRMEKAAELLYYENFSVAQIADMVGYRYTVYFTKLFKEKYGVSPREYKQRNYQ